MNSFSILLLCVLSVGVVLVFIGLLLITKVLTKIQNQLKAHQSQLTDIARSQRILANNPKDFEETKRISKIKQQP